MAVASRYQAERSGEIEGVFPISVSRILRYRECPLAYKRAYIDHIEVATTPAMELGRAAHEYFADRLRHADLGIPGVAAVMLDDWHEIVGVFNRQEWDTDNAVSIEQPYFWEWEHEGRQVQFEAKPDLVTIQGDVGAITDWKLGWRVPSSGDALRQDLQAQAYAVVLSKWFPSVETWRFQQVQFRYGGRIVGCDFSADDIEILRSALREEVAHILADTEFRPNPGCETCPVGVHDTPNVPVIVAPDGKDLAVRAPETHEEAVQIAAAVRFAERLVKAGREALEPWVDTNGPVQVGDKALGWQPSQKRSIKDRQALGAALRDLGYDPSDFVMVSALDQVLRRHPSLGDFIQTEQQPRFCWH